MGRFDGKTVVVTGGGGGIGGALCREFAAEGARVAVLDRAAGPAQEVADALISSGAQALAVTCDITERPSVDAAVDQVVSELGPIDVLVNNAGRVGSSGEAVYAACKAGLIAFSKTLAREHSRHGITFNVVCPGPTDTALLAGFVDAAANPEKLREAFRRSIPIGRIGQPDDLAGAVLFFSSDQAAFVTGQVLSVSGGLTMAG